MYKAPNNKRWKSTFDMLFPLINWQSPEMAKPTANIMAITPSRLVMLYHMEFAPKWLNRN